MLTLPPKQLRMVINKAAVERLPDVHLPDGYALRAYRAGDAESWADTLGMGSFGNYWSEERVIEFLRDPTRREGSRLVEHNGRVVAGTFASRIANRLFSSPVCGNDPTKEGVLDFVVTHPDHRGKGLGRATCIEVAKYLVADGCMSISLSTDDWRLAAIHIYLSMGFKPVFNRNDMRGRWSAVYDKLKEQGHDYSQTRHRRIGPWRYATSG